MRARPAARLLSAVKLQPAAVVAGLLLAPLPFACGGSTDGAIDVADDGGAVDTGADVPSSPHDAGLSDVAHSSDTGADTGPTGPGSQPPAPSGPVTAVTTEHNFAVSTLWLGDKARGSTTQSTTAWKNFGFNIDGKFTTAASTDVCTLVGGAAKSAQADGTQGIDNSFGANFLPLLAAISGADFSAGVNMSIATGSSTILFDTVGLSDDAMQTNTGLTAQLFSGGAFGGIPSFTTSDVWPVVPSSLADGSTIAGGAKTKFPTAYVTNGVWVSGGSSDVPVRLVSGGVEISLVIHHAVVSFAHNTATTATNGTIAGVLDTEEFVTMFKGVAGRVSTSLCSGSTIDSIATQLRQASDMLKDGTNVAGPTCDGISIGLGFDAVQIAPPSTVSPPTTPPADPCL